MASNFKNKNTEIESDLKDKLIKQFPINIEYISIDEMKLKYPIQKRRKYPNALDVLIYWENDFLIDWGEPECFGCKQLMYSEQAAEQLEKSDNYEIWKKYFQQCHIISSQFGGPSEAWNIVYLCDWCHECFDNMYLGTPDEYYKSIKWLKNRRKFVVEYMQNNMIEYMIKCNFILTPNNIHDYVSIAQSNDANNPLMNPHIKYIKNHFNPADISIASFKYAIDQLMKKNKTKELHIQQTLPIWI